MLEVWQTLVQLVALLGTLLVDLLALAFRWSPAIAWAAWWLWAADWRRLGPTLAGGAWAPVTLVGLMIALVWSFLAPHGYPLAGRVVPPFLWHLGAVAVLFAVAGLCGWLQVRLGWQPPEIDLEPAPVHVHGHAHAHEPQPTPATSEHRGHH